MRVTFERDGGDYPIPALNTPLVLDTQTLPDNEAKELEHLINNALFFTLAPKLVSPPPGAVGFFTYSITVEKDNTAHTVHLTDYNMSPPLQRLCDFLQKKQVNILSAS